MIPALDVYDIKQKLLVLILALDKLIFVKKSNLIFLNMKLHLHYFYTAFSN